VGGQSAVGPTVHDPVSEALAQTRKASSIGAHRQLCGRLRDPQPRKSEEARAWTQGGDDSVGPDSNEQKTCIRNAKQESFDFLGYTVWAALLVENRQAILGSQSVQEGDPATQGGGLRNVCELVRPTVGKKFATTSMPSLRGWQNYFSYGSLSQAYRIVDGTCTNAYGHFLRRRHHDTNSRGTRQFSDTSGCTENAAFTASRGESMTHLRGPDRNSPSESRMPEIGTSGF